MNPHIRRHLPLAALLAAALPSLLAAQDERPRRGKIDEVERSAGDSSSSRDDGEGSFWLIRIGADLVHAFFMAPREPGQGYLAYPYSEEGAVESFVLDDVDRHRRFGAFAAGLFDDASSTLRGSMFSLESANDMLHVSLEFTGYREVKATEVDRMQTLRLGVGAAPGIGTVGFLRVGLGARAICLDSGSCAAGGDLELGAQLFPRRPLGVSLVARIGGVDWPSGSSSLVTETQTAASVFVGRIELRAGWHWLKLSGASAFAGPTLSSRIWF